MRLYIPSTRSVASVDTSPHTQVYLAASLMVTSVKISCWVYPSEEIWTPLPGCSSLPSFSQVQNTFCLSSLQVKVTLSPSLAFVSSRGWVNLAGFSAIQQKQIKYIFYFCQYLQQWNLNLILWKWKRNIRLTKPTRNSVFTKFSNKKKKHLKMEILHKTTFNIRNVVSDLWPWWQLRSLCCWVTEECIRPHPLEWPPWSGAHVCNAHTGFGFCHLGSEVFGSSARSQGHLAYSTHSLTQTSHPQ